MQAHLYHLQNLSALHVGTGQGVGVVDLPIARSKATNLPVVPGSGLKGVLRDELQAQKQLNKEQVKALFGPDSSAEVSHAGAIALGDANLLLLPIRSFSGTIAYATCPYILRQYQRDLGSDLKIPKLDEQQAGVVEDSVLFVGRTREIALEDLDIQANYNDTIQQWADVITRNIYPEGVAQAEDWREQMSRRFVILPDDIFSFLADTATEIRIRIRIDRDARIVKEGALWSEENLPAETVLWGVMGIADARDRSGLKADELSALLPQDEIIVQVGGKHTVGRGLCRLLIAKNQLA